MLKAPRIRPTAVAVLLMTTLAPAPATATAAAQPPAQVVIEWNRMLVSALAVTETPPPPAMRIGAIVATSVFDAVATITHRYAPYHVTAKPPEGASAQAAAAGAAHEALVTLFPDHRKSFDEARAITKARLVSKEGPVAVDRGLEWGATVADAILALRANDGINGMPPAYVVSQKIGRWQPTPPAFPPAPAFRQFATVKPWVLRSPSQFTPPPPPRLKSARYARDFNEVKVMGAATSDERDKLDTLSAKLWQSAAPVVLWDPVVETMIIRHDLGLTDAARLMAQVNVAMADAVIVVWNAKNRYDTWRPVTAIRDAGKDGNPRTRPDANWAPLLDTPPFQEYPAGHPTVSQAAAAVLAHRFGDRTRYTVKSPAMSGFALNLTSFSAGVRNVIDARVDGGIHFRFACEAGAAMGRKVAAYVETRFSRPRR